MKGDARVSGAVQVSEETLSQSETCLGLAPQRIGTQVSLPCEPFILGEFGGSS